MDERLAERRADLVSVYRDLHRNPELAGEEERTARRVAEHLRGLAFEVRTGVGGHGVVGVLRGGAPGGVVAFRADMDAFATNDPDPVEYRSQVPGVRHICGHDLHTTVGMALAEALDAVRGEIAGTVVLIFQPAEETATGAKAMIDGGAMSAPKPDAIFALHATPLEVGELGSTAGLLLPATTMATASIRGGGDLQALVNAGLPLFQQMTEIVPADAGRGGSLEGMPLSKDFVVVQPFGSDAGPGEGEWTLRAMIRGSSDERFAEGRKKLAAALDEITRGKATFELEFLDGVTSGADNDPDLVRAADEDLREALGEENVLRMAGAVPFFSEDFGQFQALTPGAMYWLGVSNSKSGIRGMPHAPDFAIDEEAIFVGARAMSAVLLGQLERLAAGRDDPSESR